MGMKILWILLTIFKMGMKILWILLTIGELQMFPNKGLY
jgi:hypothetical protein